MIVAPGIVDAHTHYDPQITFDPYATMSCFHGVTTVVAGNCGFSVAPCKPDDRAFLSGIFARVESMDPIALSAITWDDFDDVPRVPREPRGQARHQLRVLHRPLQPAALGDGRRRVDARRDRRRDRADARDGRARRWTRARPGVSSSDAPTHLDLDDQPVPSRLAEQRRAARRSRRRPARPARGRSRTCPRSAIGGIDATDEDYLIELGKVSGCPVVIQGLGGRNKTDAPTATWEAAESFLDRATEAGRAGLLDADRAAVRPPGRDRRDQLPLPRGAERGTGC